jgi:hypothetical protein
MMIGQDRTRKITRIHNDSVSLIRARQNTYQKIPPMFFESKEDGFPYKNVDRLYNQKNKYLFGMKGSDKNGVY